MAEICCDVLKTQVEELFTDLLSLKLLTIQQKSTLMFAKSLVDSTSSQIIMDLLSEDLIKADIDHLEKNGKDLFEYIFLCAGKKNVSQEMIKDIVEDLYKKLSVKDKETISQYARCMKHVCERWASSQHNSKR